MSVLKLIDRIEHLKLSQVTSFQSNASGSAIITYTGNPFILPISRSSARFRCESERGAQGKSYNIAVSSNLKEEISDLEPGVYLIKLEDGTTLIIGTKDYPVLYNSDQSLTENSFSFNYKSLTKPLKRHI